MGKNWCWSREGLILWHYYSTLVRLCNHNHKQSCFHSYKMGRVPAAFTYTETTKHRPLFLEENSILAVDRGAAGLSQTDRIVTHPDRPLLPERCEHYSREAPSISSRPSVDILCLVLSKKRLQRNRPLVCWSIMHHCLWELHESIRRCVML